LAVHVDGYIATVAITKFLTSEKVEGKAGDLLAAAYFCQQAALRVLKPGYSVFYFN
jgi:methionine aminopeptidase